MTFLWVYHLHSSDSLNYSNILYTLQITKIKYKHQQINLNYTTNDSLTALKKVGKIRTNLDSFDKQYIYWLPMEQYINAIILLVSVFLTEV